MLLPQWYITALDCSLGGTVCEMGSVGRNWKNTQLGKPGVPHHSLQTTEQQHLQSRGRRLFGLKYCSTFQTGALPQRPQTQPYSPSTTGVVNISWPRLAGTKQLLQNICLHGDLTGANVLLPRHMPKREILTLEEHGLQQCNLPKGKLNQYTPYLW